MTEQKNPDELPDDAVANAADGATNDAQSVSDVPGVNTDADPSGSPAADTTETFDSMLNADAPTVESPTSPANAAPSASTATPTAVTEPKRLPAKFGTILWGVLLLVFAAFMVTNTIIPLMQDPIMWLIGGVIAAGVVLVIAGIAAAVRRA